MLQSRSDLLLKKKVFTYINGEKQFEMPQIHASSTLKTLLQSIGVAFFFFMTFGLTFSAIHIEEHMPDANPLEDAKPKYWVGMLAIFISLMTLIIIFMILRYKYLLDTVIMS